MRLVKRFVAVVGIALICSGCALTTAHIDVPYQSDSNATPVTGANSAVISVIGIDGRTTYRDRVSSKKNGYGIEMAAIVATNDIPSTVADAFTQELTARGFKVGPGGASLKVEVVRFYNDFKPGFFSGDAVATVAFNVSITSPTGTILFSKYYEGTGVNPNIQSAGGDNARIALIKAFTSSVSSVFSDPDFLNALLATGRQGPRPTTSTQPGS